MERESSLPNFLIVVTDQQRADYLGCYGHPVVRTPHIDALAKAGSRFDRCYVASPVCMPNRASLMTGRMPSVHGTRMNGISLSREELTFADLLLARGYRTALIGKSHLQNMEDLPPFVRKDTTGPLGRWSPPEHLAESRRREPADAYEQELPHRWRGQEPLVVEKPYYGFSHVDLCTGHGDQVGGHYYQWLRNAGHDPHALMGRQNSLPHKSPSPQAWRTKVPEDLYSTRYIERQALEFLRAHQNCGASPFCLVMSFPDPHHPFTPPGRYFDMYDPAEALLPASFNCSDDVLPQVRWARDKRRSDPGGTGGFGALAVTESEARSAIALTCGQISMIDDAVGSVVGFLREAGLFDNTVIVFTSDHGDLMGDHGLLFKGPVHLHSLVRVPLIWSDPESRFCASRIGSLCSTIDIAATILDRAGIEPFSGIQGRSLLPWVAGTPGSELTSVLIEEDAYQPQLGFSVPPRIRTVVTPRYRMSIYGRGNHGELFDLQKDPDELRNLWDDVACSQVRCELHEELALKQLESADRSPMPTRLA